MFGNYTFEMIAKEGAVREVFGTLLREGKIKYKAYVAWYELDIKRTFFPDYKNYKVRKIKWAKRYLKKHNHTMEEFDKLIAEEINDMKELNKTLLNVMREKNPAVSKFIQKYI